MTNQLTLADWAPPLRQELSQYHTPVRLARRMVRWLWPKDVVSTTFLEPSAGGGNIVRELCRIGGQVTAFEVDPAWARLLAGEFCTATVICEDFLQHEPRRFDCAVMNPPLDGGVGPRHVAHALRFAPVVVSVLRLADLVGVDHHRELWSWCDLMRIALLVHRPAFTGKGGATDFCVVEVRRRIGACRPPQKIEFWEDRWDA